MKDDIIIALIAIGGTIGGAILGYAMGAGYL